MIPPLPRQPLIGLMGKNFLETLLKSPLPLEEQTSTEEVAMAVVVVDVEDPWAAEALEVEAVVVAAVEDSPVEGVVVEANRELETGNVLIPHVRT